MFDFIRTHQRLMQFLLLLFIFPSFAFFGLEGYTRMSDSNTAVAKVAGQTISQQEFDTAYRQQMEQFRQMFGDQFDATMFDTPQARQGILDNLIAQRALAAEASRNKLAVSDQTLQQTILAIPGLTTPDGKFDSERYKSLLAVQGLSPAGYESRLRQDLVLQQVNAAVQNTAFAPKTVAARLSDLNEQEREVQEFSFKIQDYVSQVKITDDMLKDFYEKNSTRFQVPEVATAEYLILSPAAVASQISVSDADIKSYYDQNSKRYIEDEQRRASHILIAANKDAPAAEKNAAKAKADKLLAQLRTSPGDFAKLAKENSQDPGSAEKGGDLDFFTKGSMVKPFEDAAYKLKQGEISDVVQSDFGFHIIQVTGIKPAVVRTLDQAKGEIAEEIKKQLSAKKYTEMAEILTNTVYEQSESLKPAADKLKLKIETAANLNRQPNPALPPTVAYNNPKFLNALFADDSVKNKRNTEAVEVAPNTMIAGRIVDYKPTTKRPFEEVKESIRAQVTQVEAAKLARQAGEAKLAELKTKPGAVSFGDAKLVSRTKNAGMRNEAFTAVMKADTTTLPALTGVDIPAQGYSIFRINKIGKPANSDTARRTAEQQQISNALAQQEMVAYIDVLKKKAKVEIIKPAASTPAPTN